MTDVCCTICVMFCVRHLLLCCATAILSAVYKKQLCTSTSIRQSHVTMKIYTFFRCGTDLYKMKQDVKSLYSVMSCSLNEHDSHMSHMVLLIIYNHIFVNIMSITFIISSLNAVWLAITIMWYPGNTII